MKKIALNVGSGQRRFDSTSDVEWINIDAQSAPDRVPDIQCDGAHLTMFEDASVDYFVLSQVYEHFGLGEADGLIKEAYRVLKPWGSLIISVPNMRALAERWLAGQISEYIFMVNTYGAYMGNEADRHKWGTTPESLRDALLKAAPWRIVKQFSNYPIPGLAVPQDWWITRLEAIR
jgi:ubiquinone/menaquinone biosynthesis C-methylase UbiE